MTAPTEPLTPHHRDCMVNRPREWEYTLDPRRWDKMASEAEFVWLPCLDRPGTSDAGRSPPDARIRVRSGYDCNCGATPRPTEHPALTDAVIRGLDRISALEAELTAANLATLAAHAQRISSHEALTADLARVTADLTKMRRELDAARASLAIETERKYELINERDTRERERDAARTAFEIAIEGLDPMTETERANWTARLDAARKEAGL